jgi:hypothetical protein
MTSLIQSRDRVHIPTPLPLYRLGVSGLGYDTSKNTLLPWLSAGARSTSAEGHGMPFRRPFLVSTPVYSAGLVQRSAFGVTA